MDLEVVTIGTELVLGQTIDTNAAYLARALAAAGVRVVRKTSVPDEPALMRDAIAGGLARTRVVVTSGGLGPTRDDRTRQVVADLCGVPLVTDADYLAHLVGADWYALNDQPLNGMPMDLVMVGPELYAGGYFTDAGGCPACDYFSRWGSTEWVYLPTMIKSQ